MEPPESTSSRAHETSRRNPVTWHQVRGHMVDHLSWLVLLAIVLIISLLLVLIPGFRHAAADAWTVLSSGDQIQIREYMRGFGAWAPLASVLLMTAQVILAPIPASVVQLANGVVFGVFGGAVLNLIGQMAGATAAFMISRALGRTAAERLAGRIDEHGVIEHWLDRWGGKALFLVRAIPGMPSDFVSYLMGLTNMPARKYITISLLGYIPQSLAYAWLGDIATGWFWWIVLGGFAISGVIAAVVWLMRKTMNPPTRPALEIEPERDSRQA